MHGGGQGAGYRPAAAEWPWLGPLGGDHVAAEPPLPPSPVLACTLVMERKTPRTATMNERHCQCVHVTAEQLLQGKT